MNRFGRFLLVALTFIAVHLNAQSDIAGSGRALSFDGVDDYIDFGNNYADLQLPFTVSAWTYLDGDTFFGPIFSNRNCFTVYTGFRLIIDDNYITVEYGDGLGGGSPAFRRGKESTLSFNLTSGWNHITAVVRSVSSMDLYVNGVNVGGQSQGNSNNTMRSDIPNGLTTSGYFVSNNVVYRYKGLIDDIRLWNRALTEAEIRNTMCINLIGNESGLIGYWDFNEVSGSQVFDKSPNRFTGNFVGNPKRVYSGAPIGNRSTSLYTGSFTDVVVSLTDPVDQSKVSVSNITGNPLGVQIYEVQSPPSQTDGLTMVGGSYYGVFLAREAGKFNVVYQVNNHTASIFTRADNSKNLWTSSSNPLISNIYRAEMIPLCTTPASIDLGEDKMLCDAASYMISTGVTPADYEFLWSTGARTASINVTTSGTYSVKVTGKCFVLEDAVKVIFETKPQPVVLGNDITSCTLVPTTLTAIDEINNVDIEWQDGSSKITYQVKDFGKYWVTVSNICGQASDTIVFRPSRFAPQEIPNVITPNGDGKNDQYVIGPLADQLSFIVVNRWGNEVYRSANYRNDWDGGDLSVGVYFLVMEDQCGNQVKTPVTILR